jgi:hypothetical protein
MPSIFNHSNDPLKLPGDAAKYDYFDWQKTFLTSSGKYHILVTKFDIQGTSNLYFLQL